MAVTTSEPYRRSVVASDNHLLHKIHSLTGIIPIGLFLVQHLTLNSFAFAGKEQFNAVIRFFNEIMPHHLFFLMEWGVIFIPLLFHGLYGLLITSHGSTNVGSYNYFRNWMYVLQRVSGVLLVAYIGYHVYTTTFTARMQGLETIYYDAMAERLANPWIAFIYLAGITSATFHLANGVWNFAIRWGLVLSARSQQVFGYICLGLFAVLTGWGWFAFYAFRMH